MTLQMGHRERLQEVRKESANGCSWSRQDHHPLPSQILHLQLHPNSRIQFFGSSLSIEKIKQNKKKSSNIHTYPARVKVGRKGQILILCT